MKMPRPVYLTASKEWRRLVCHFILKLHELTKSVKLRGSQHQTVAWLPRRKMLGSRSERVPASVGSDRTARHNMQTRASLSLIEKLDARPEETVDPKNTSVPGWFCVP